ncbi:MAG: TonB-dependent receptor plug domain-containing protein [Opitutaceae bacterium]|nr:TonB-dependent receptor plug domain-containing protein [Opitutaceae bacterium]MBP9912017.1 TonB-dependent receptor plug domain-containing protein [Opitutaceae bacterium]
MKNILPVFRGLGRVALLLTAGAVLANAQTVSSDTNEASPVKLSPFEVTADKDYGYRKSSTVTTSRISIPVVKNPQSVEIISGELLRDMSVALPKEVFRYSSTVMVGEAEVGQAGIFTLRSFQLPIFYNGLGLASSFSLTPIVPVDNIDRVEIAKGPVALYFTNSTPNGVANYVTKKPQFINATEFKMIVGSYDYSKAVLDTQYVISKEKGMAFRLISSYQNMGGRVDGQEHNTLTFVDPSFIYKPNDKFSFTAEYATTKQNTPYATFEWNLAMNPQYWTDVMNPSAQLVTYMQTAYSLPSSAAALAKINERWGYPTGNPNGSTQGVVQNSYMTNWSNDILGMTGTAPRYFTTSTIDWWRFSNRGDKFLSKGPDSNYDGGSQLADISIDVTPFTELAIRYHWLHMVNNTAFTRQLIQPTAGLRPDGRVTAMNAAAAISWTPHRFAATDAQQLDASYQIEALGMKHFFSLGYERDRSFATIDNVTIDLAKAAAGISAGGYALTGASAYQHYDPFGATKMQGIYAVVASGPRQTNLSISNFEAATVSYRGSAMDDRLNVIAGLRRSKLINTGRTDVSPTLGAIFEVTKGFHVFASASEMVTFTNNLSAQGGGLLPSDNSHLLDNVNEKGQEWGIKTDFNDNEFSGTISMYRDERDGIVQADFAKIVADPRNLSGSAADQVQFFVNGGVVRAEGVEMDLTWTPSRNFQLITNYAWQYTAKTVSNKSLNPNTPGALANQKARERLQKSPEHRANIIGKYNFTSGPLKNLSFGGAVRYTDVYSLQDNVSIDIQVPSEVIIDLFATYTTKIADVPTDFQFNVINATNEINDITRSNGLEFRLSAGVRF